MALDEILRGKEALEGFLRNFDGDMIADATISLSHLDPGKLDVESNYFFYNENNYEMRLILSGNHASVSVIDFHLIDIGDPASIGKAFTYKRHYNQGDFEGYTHAVKINKGSNLDILMETQVREDFMHMGSSNTSAAYDLPSLIPHDPGHHDVNFTWIEAIFGVNVENDLNRNAGSRLLDLLEILYKDDGIDRILFIGERARGYAGVADKSRLNVPWTTSRPQEQKMQKDMITIETYSEYSREKPKIHQVSRTFMEGCDGKKVLVIDDLGATHNTIFPFLKTVQKYEGLAQGCTLIDLDYIAKDERVDLGDFRRMSIFQEKKPSVVTYAPEFIAKVYRTE